MKPKSLYPVAAIILAVPVFGISVWAALNEPNWLNPWRKSDGFMDLNLWYFVLPQLICSLAIIVSQSLAVFGSTGWRAELSNAADSR